MSGGSHNYAYQKVDDMAGTLIESRDPLRRAFANHLKKVSTAMHDIEWVDSCDYGPGGEVKAIEAVLGNNSNLLTKELIEDALKAMENNTSPPYYTNLG